MEKLVVENPLSEEEMERADLFKRLGESLRPEFINLINQFENKSVSSNVTGNSGCGTTVFPDNQWSLSTLIKTDEYNDSIEMIYKQQSLLSYTGLGFNQPPQERIYKIVFSVVDGKWNRSEPIYGTIIPAHDEDYEFDE